MKTDASKSTSALSNPQPPTQKKESSPVRPPIESFLSERLSFGIFQFQSPPPPPSPFYPSLFLVSPLTAYPSSPRHFYWVCDDPDFFFLGTIPHPKKETCTPLPLPRMGWGPLERGWMEVFFLPGGYFLCCHAFLTSFLR